MFFFEFFLFLLDILYETIYGVIILEKKVNFDCLIRTSHYLYNNTT